MLNIGYKTKSNDNPKGKSRVWFCAHKNDYKYLSDVLHDVFEYTNAAVYYDLNPNDDTLADDLSELSEMNLFIMPVTSNLLYTSNRAIDKELIFALQNKIPVLPIVYEKGLDKQFYVKCGNLQYLDKINDDETAISYAEKFKKFVSKIILGDNMYDKVRKAFDAYIFLSYRKKDRLKAKELMSLIHANDFCRDIAIWYDEFLTPGEDFNASISKALEKSELFVMAVTPNVVNEDNYVMKVEYPEAVKAGKKIIPAKLEDVNEEALKSKYKGIPDSVDARNIKLLADMLSNSLKDVALLANDKDTLHNYLIGLAYLYGIDVEVNGGMALKLIKKSADDGLIVAIEKLSDMYYNGEGVNRDLLTAIEYKTKSVRSYYDKFKSETTIDNLDKFIEEINELADFYSVMKSYSKAEKIYNALINQLNTFSCPDNEVLIKRPLVEAYRNHGKTLEKLNDASCVTDLEKAVELSEEIVKETNKISDKRLLSKAYTSLSCSYLHSFKDGDKSWDEYGNQNLGPLKSGRERESLELAKKVLKLDEEIAKETGLFSDKTTIYYDYSTLNNAYLSLQDYKDERENVLELAKESREKALELALTFEGYEDRRAKRILSYAYIDLGDKYHYKKEFDKAEEYYLKALNLRKERYQKSPTISNIDDLDSVYFGLMSNAKAQGDYQKALKYAEEKISLCKEVYDIANFEDARTDLANAYDSYARILIKLGEKETAKIYIEKAEDLKNENISKIVDTKEKAEKLYWHYNDLLEKACSLKEYDNINNYFNKMAEAFNILIKENKLDYVMTFAITARMLGLLFLERDYGDNEFHPELYASPICYYKKSNEIFTLNLSNAQMQEVALAEYNIARNYELLGEAYNYLGEEDNVIDSFNKAIYYREKSYKDWISVCKNEYKNACMEFEIVKTLVKYSWAYEKDESAKMYYRSREILQRIVEKFPNEKSFNKKYDEVCKYIELYYSEYEQKF